MTNKQINERIALLCGFTPCPLFSNQAWTKEPSGFIGPFVFSLPNYATDLNACHEFEKILTYEQAELYDDELCDICAETNELLDNPKPWRFAVTTATARQRCEAFLRAHGQWEEEA